MAITIRLEVFEGPMDLLLHLIEKNKLNIYDIPIVEVTEQYLLYLTDMEKLNMEITSEFLVMAATLLNIKAKMLLPKQKEEEEDPRDELVQKLIEYKKYKFAATQMESMIVGSNLILTKKPTIPEELYVKPPVPPLSVLLENITLKSLYDVYMKVMNNQKSKIDPIRSKFKAIEKDQFTVEEKISFLMDKLRVLKSITFNTLLENRSKSERITTFLALLELIKMNDVFIRQEFVFGEIEVNLKGDNNEFE